MIELKIALAEDGTASIAASPQLAGNRIAMYGLLQMGLELVHRMGDEQKPRSNIVVPELRIQ